MDLAPAKCGGSGSETLVTSSARKLVFTQNPAAIFEVFKVFLMISKERMYKYIRVASDIQLVSFKTESSAIRKSDSTI